MKPRKKTRERLIQLYEKLLAAFGNRDWWPADTPFEVCVGAILAQNTAWSNVKLAMANLKAAQALDAFTLYSMPHDELAELIRPARFMNVKAQRLRNFMVHLVERRQGDLNQLFAGDIDSVRKELLSIKGVGKETADSMILYAGDKPIFVVDAYTKRVLVRHGLVDERADYDQMQELFHACLPRDPSFYNDFHAQIVAVGARYCKKKPKCDECPLGQDGELTLRKN